MFYLVFILGFLFVTMLFNEREETIRREFCVASYGHTGSQKYQLMKNLIENSGYKFYDNPDPLSW